MACCADTVGLSMTMSFDGARPIKTMSQTSSYVTGRTSFCTIKLAIECDAPACVAFQGAALCRVYSRHCFLRNLPANVSQKFQKKLEIVETWGNSPEYFTLSSEWWRKFAKSPTTSVIVPGRYEEKLEDSPNLKSFSNPGLRPLFQTTLFGSDCALHTVRRGGARSSVLIQDTGSG